MQPLPAFASVGRVAICLGLVASLCVQLSTVSRASTTTQFHEIRLTVGGEIDGVPGPHLFLADLRTENPLSPGSSGLVTSPTAPVIVPGVGFVFGSLSGLGLTLVDNTLPGQTNPDPYNNIVVTPDPLADVAGVSGMMVGFGDDRMSDTGVRADDALDPERFVEKKLTYTVDPGGPVGHHVLAAITQTSERRDVDLDHDLSNSASARFYPFATPPVFRLTARKATEDYGAPIDGSYEHRTSEHTFSVDENLEDFLTGMIVLSKDVGTTGVIDFIEQNHEGDNVTAKLISGDGSRSITLEVRNPFEPGERLRPLEDPFIAGVELAIPEPASAVLAALGLASILAVRVGTIGKRRPGAT